MKTLEEHNQFIFSETKKWLNSVLKSADTIVEAAEVAQMKPATLRRMCVRHGIPISGRAPAIISKDVVQRAFLDNLTAPELSKLTGASIPTAYKAFQRYGLAPRSTITADRKREVAMLNLRVPVGENETPLCAMRKSAMETTRATKAIWG